MHEYNVLEKGQKIDKAQHALILLHGRGATADDLLPLTKILCDDTFYVAAPQATNKIWYPTGFMADEKLNEPWLSSAIEYIKKVIDNTAKYIPKKNIYILGFSQGACLSLEVTTRYAEKYAGVVAFSGGLIGPTIDPKKYSGNFNNTKVFIGNSDRDPYIPMERSQKSGYFMEDMGAEVFIKIYRGMAHTISVDETDFVKKYIFNKFN